jgi:pyruvate kinase
MTGEQRDIRTKIVCTIGPSSNSEETLRAISSAGMDVARINSGYTSLEDVTRYMGLIRKASGELEKRIAVMLDLQGPRLRTGAIKDGIAQLEEGQRYTLTSEIKLGNAELISVPYDGLADDLKPGDSVLIDDGRIRLVVDETDSPEVHCTVEVGGLLRQGKGLNFPGVDLNLPAVTSEDLEYLKVGLKGKVDWIAQSFVRSGEDVRSLRKAIEDLGSSVPVIAKIEMEQAVGNIDSILEESQGIMVARGDLGVEMNIEDVPLVQKSLIQKALRAGRPVVTATQMLESMVEKPGPTRAEASDVANAILDGTDAVMLSAETAIGAYPARAVEVMRHIALRTERELDYERILEERGRWRHGGLADAIGYAACKIASDLRASAILTITRSGYTGMTVARFRPKAQVLAASPNEEVANMMTLVWGVSGIVAPLYEDVKETLTEVIRRCKEEGFIESGDLIVVISGFLDREAGTTNSINVHTVE